MRRRADQRELAADRARRRFACLEQPQPHLHPQDPANRIVQALRGESAVLCRRQRGLIETLPAVRRHGHIQAGVDRGRAIGGGAALDLAVAVPVAHHEATEVHATLKRIGQVRLVTVHLLAIDAVEGRHHGLRARGDGRRVAGGVDAHQLGLADPGIALVLAIGGAAVTEKMLDRGDHMAAIQECRRADLALQALDHGSRIAGHHLGRFGIALVGAPPAIVLRHRHGGRERPLHPGRTGLQRGDLADAAQQVRVAGGAQADVVREQGRADDVALPVHGIDAEKHRNRLAALRGIHRRLVERIGQRQPLRRRGVVAAARVGVAPGQDRAEPVLAQVIRGDAGNIALHQLAHLLLHRHAGHEVGDALLERGVLGQRPGHLRPRLRLRLGHRRCNGRVIVRAGSQCQQQRGQQDASAGARKASIRHCVHPSICSSSLPLVSCTYRSTKKTERIAATR